MQTSFYCPSSKLPVQWVSVHTPALLLPVQLQTASAVAVSTHPCPSIARPVTNCQCSGCQYTPLPFYCPSSYKLPVQWLSVHTPALLSSPSLFLLLSPVVFRDVAKTKEVNGLCVNPSVTPAVKCSALEIESIAISAADCSPALNTAEIAVPSYFINCPPLQRPE